jgi:hypothetical protein
VLSTFSRVLWRRYRRISRLEEIRYIDLDKPVCKFSGFLIVLLGFYGSLAELAEKREQGER